MTAVPTMHGPVEAADLGRTYMHEHVFVLTPDVQLNHPEEWGDEEGRIADAAQKLQGLVDQGVRTIVDPTVVGLGRYIPRIRRVAERVPELNIVVADQVVLSHDAACYIDWIDPDVLSFLPQWHYRRIGDEVLPYLREHGITEDQIDTMLVTNPRRYFEP